jgi:hypothetical protein
MDAVDYRAKARELREKARTMRDLRSCGELLAIAEEYDRLAERAEAKERETEKS